MLHTHGRSDVLGVGEGNDGRFTHVLSHSKGVGMIVISTAFNAISSSCVSVTGVVAFADGDLLTNPLR